MESAHSPLPTHVRGKVVYPGKVRGIAIVVRTNMVYNLQPGHIIIAATKNMPTFEIGLTHVAGIILDDGELNCPAAIMSTEYKIPCIIKTNRATEIFETGDLIEINTNKSLGEITAIKWRKGVRRWSPVLWRYFSTLGHTSQYATSALDINRGLDTCKNVGHQTFLASDEYDHLSNELANFSTKDQKYFLTIAMRCYARCEELLNISREINQQVKEISDWQELLKLFERYHDATLATIPFRYGILILDEILDKMLKERILFTKKVKPDDVNNTIRALIVSSKPSFELAYNRELTQLAASFLETVKQSVNIEKIQEVEELLNNIFMLKETSERILAEYAWITTSYFTGEPLSIRSLAEELLQILKTDNPRNILVKWTRNENAAKSRKEALLKQLHLSDSDVALLEIAEIYTHLRSYRISICFKADFIVRHLLEKIASTLGIPYHLLIQMTGQEIINSMKKKKLIVGLRPQSGQQVKLMPTMRENYGKNTKKTYTGIQNLPNSGA